MHTNTHTCHTTIVGFKALPRETPPPALHPGLGGLAGLLERMGAAGKSETQDLTPGGGS